MKIGMIGAGSISVHHLNAFKANPDAEVVMIADVSENLAKTRAEAYGIPKYCTDYKELLSDDTIEAVSIATPTFTHCQIVCEALAAGKHVLCEKPPALTAAEAQKCADAAKASGKVLMYALVCRFSSEAQYLAKLRDDGSFGKIYAAEAFRRDRSNAVNGWFVDKTKSGGGMLMDATIHEVDLALYLMGYPKPKSVLGFATDINKDLPQRLVGYGSSWKSATNEKCERTVESMANGFVTFENGACLTVTSSHIQFCKPGRFIEVSGEKAGVRIDGFQNDLSLVTVDPNGYMTEFKPTFNQKADMFRAQMDHFVDCCVNGTPCIVTPEQSVILMTVIENLYKSAELGKAIEL